MATEEETAEELIAVDVSAPEGGVTSDSQECVAPVREKRRSVNAEVLQQVHQMHEQHVAEQKSREGSLLCCRPCGPMPLVRNDELARAWGINGSWQVSAKMPGTREEKHSIRGIDILPRSQPKTMLDDWGIGTINSKGTKGPSDRTPGQDNFSVSRLSNGWEAFCVMDGHGPDGHWPATRAVQTLPFFLQGEACNEMLQKGEAGSALMYAFCKTESDLVQRAEIEGIDLHVCGCTATVVLRHPKEYPDSVWVAHVGDSRALHIAAGGGIIGETNDHKPLLVNEKLRLETMGCEVKSTHHSTGFVETRIFLKGKEYPGLSMSRSLGDLLVKENGVTWEPEIVEWSMKDNPGSLIIGASDGVWEFLSNEEVGEMIIKSISEGKTHRATVSEIMRVSRTLWLENQGPFYCDDISMFLFFTDMQAAPACETVSEINNAVSENPCNVGCVVS